MPGRAAANSPQDRSAPTRTLLQCQQRRGEKGETGGEYVSGEQVDPPAQPEGGGGTRAGTPRQPSRGPDDEGQQREAGNDIQVVDLGERRTSEGVRDRPDAGGERGNAEETRQEKYPESGHRQMEDRKEFERTLQRQDGHSDPDRIERADVGIRGEGPTE